MRQSFLCFVPIVAASLVQDSYSQRLRTNLVFHGEPCFPRRKKLLEKEDSELVLWIQINLPEP